MFGPVADVARHCLLRDAAHAFESPQVDAEEEEKKKKSRGGEEEEEKKRKKSRGGVEEEEKKESLTGESPDLQLEAEINTPKSGIIKIKQIKEILKNDKHW